MFEVALAIFILRFLYFDGYLYNGTSFDVCLLFSEIAPFSCLKIIFILLISFITDGWFSSTSSAVGIPTGDDAVSYTAKVWKVSLIEEFYCWYKFEEFLDIALLCSPVLLLDPIDYFFKCFLPRITLACLDGFYPTFRGTPF